MNGRGRVIWLGGSFAGGKTTTARALSETFGLEVYHADRDIINNPDLEFAKVEDHKWFWLPVAAKLERYEKVISHVFEQARKLSESQDIIVEGPCLLPRFLSEQCVSPEDVAILIPTPEHQRFANVERRKHWNRDILDDFEDKTKAWNEWMAVDDEFADYLLESANDLGYPVVRNDGSVLATEVAGRLAKRFGLTRP